MDVRQGFLRNPQHGLGNGVIDGCRFSKTSEASPNPRSFSKTENKRVHCTAQAAIAEFSRVIQEGQGPNFPIDLTNGFVDSGEGHRARGPCQLKRWATLSCRATRSAQRNRAIPGRGAGARTRATRAIPPVIACGGPASQSVPATATKPRPLCCQVEFAASVPPGPGTTCQKPGDTVHRNAPKRNRPLDWL